MARGTTLLEMVRQLRLETGRSGTAAASTDSEAKLKEALWRNLEFYYDDYDWPHMHVQRSITLANNQRFYTFPTTLVFETVTDLWVKNDGRYIPLTRGIGFGNYNTVDSLAAVAAVGSFDITGGTASAGVNTVATVPVNSVDILGGTAVDWITSNAATATAVAVQINATTSSPNYTATASGAKVTITATLTAGADANTFVVAPTVGGDVTVGALVDMTGGVDAEMSDPVSRWDVLENEESGNAEIEMWPVPSSVDTVYLFGKKALSAFTADTDTCDLDDLLIVLTSAAEFLSREKKEDAPAKAAAAQRRYTKLKGRQNARRTPFQLRGSASPPKPRGTTINITR